MAADLLTNMISNITAFTEKVAQNTVQKTDYNNQFSQVFDDAKSKINKNVSEKKEQYTTDTTKKHPKEDFKKPVERENNQEKTHFDDEKRERTNKDEEKNLREEKEPSQDVSQNALNNILIGQVDVEGSTESATQAQDLINTAILTETSILATSTQQATGETTSSAQSMQTATAAAKATMALPNEVSADDVLIKADTLVSKLQNATDNIETIDNITKDSSLKITQDIVDSLDAKVTSVQTADGEMKNGAQGEFFNRQSLASEELIKMSLETPEQTTTSFAEVISTASTTTPTTMPNSVSPIISEQMLINPTLNQLTASSVQTSTQSTSTEAFNNVLNQINSKINLPQENGTSKVNIVLQPENLGKVSVEIMHTKDGVTAKMLAETPQVKELLDKSIESLKNTIASQGVNVNNITVKVEETASAQNANLGFEQEEFNRESQNQSNREQQSQETYKDSDRVITSYGLQEEPEQDIVTESIQNTVQHTTYNHNGQVNITI